MNWDGSCFESDFLIKDFSSHQKTGRGSALTRCRGKHEGIVVFRPGDMYLLAPETQPMQGGEHRAKSLGVMWGVSNSRIRNKEPLNYFRLHSSTYSLEAFYKESFYPRDGFSLSPHGPELYFLVGIQRANDARYWRILIQTIEHIFRILPTNPTSQSPHDPKLLDTRAL